MNLKLPDSLLNIAIYSADFGFIVVDPKERILLWNQWMTKHSGIKEEEALGLKITEVFNLDSKTKINFALRQALDSGKSALLSPTFAPHHLPLYRKMGNNVLMTQRIVTRPIKIENERYCSIEISDQSAGAEREKFLQTTKNYIRKVVDSIQDMLFIIDHNKNICEVNDVVTETLKVEESDIINKSFLELIDDEEKKAKLDDYLGQADKPIKDFEVNFRCKGGKVLTLILSGSHITSSDEEMSKFVAIAKDITDRRKAEELLVAQKAQLAAASKLSALGEMAGGVAHEINNPMAIIHGLAYRLAKVLKKTNIPKDSDAFELISEIEATSTRITKIVKGLKTFSRSGDNDDFMPCSVKQILDDTFNLCSESFKIMGIQVHVSPYPEDLTLECRQIQISQVLLNLLNNAKDAIRDLDERWIKLEIIASDDKIRFSVEDSGTPIDKSILSKLFQPFFTTKPAGQGTGLGLSISKGLIEDHDGRFYYDSTCKHVKFVIILPKKQIRKVAA